MTLEGLMMRYRSSKSRARQVVGKALTFYPGNQRNQGNDRTITDDRDRRDLDTFSTAPSIT